MCFSNERTRTHTHARMIMRMGWGGRMEKVSPRRVQIKKIALVGV